MFSYICFLHLWLYHPVCLYRHETHTDIYIYIYNFLYIHAYTQQGHQLISVFCTPPTQRIRSILIKGWVKSARCQGASVTSEKHPKKGMEIHQCVNVFP